MGVDSIDGEVKEGELITHQDACLSPLMGEIAWQAPLGHGYPVFVMQLALEQMINSFVSLRGCQSNLKSLASFFTLPVPCFSTLRDGSFRLGLFELQRPRERRSDWIIIIDMTIESAHR